MESDDTHNKRGRYSRTRLFTCNSNVQRATTGKERREGMERERECV